MKKLVITVILLLLVFPLFMNAQENSFERTKRIKPALIVIDMQNAFTEFMEKSDKDLAINYINYAIELFRKNGYPVIRVHHTDPESGPKPGTEAFEFISSVGVKKDDPQIIKNYGDSFNKTDLDKMLKEKKVNTVFLCGFNSVGCVLSTFVGANNHDYTPFFIKDALIGHKPNYSNYVEEIFDAISLDVIKILIEKSDN